MVVEGSQEAAQEPSARRHHLASGRVLYPQVSTAQVPAMFQLEKPPDGCSKGASSLHKAKSGAKGRGSKQITECLLRIYHPQSAVQDPVRF